MTFVALALVAAQVMSTLGFLGLIAKLVRQHGRERDLLVDKILHLSGRTWRAPPADSAPVPELEPLNEDELFEDVDQGVPV